MKKFGVCFKRSCLFLCLLLVSLWGANQPERLAYASDTGPIPVTVQVQTSDGNPIPGARARYQIADWKEIGNTDAAGQVNFEVPANTRWVNVRLYYEGTYFTLRQDVTQDPVFTFQTINTVVSLTDSRGNPLANGKIRFSRSNWGDFGTTDASGVARKELLPGTYFFRLSYEIGRQDIRQDISQNNRVEFKTIQTRVRLISSDQTGLENGAVTFSRASWMNFGTTGEEGVAVREALPGTYNFRMQYERGRVDVRQDITHNPVITFQTIRTVVKVVNQNNLPLPGASIIHSRASWIDFGVTDASGEAIRQVLPGTYSVRVRYDNVNYNRKMDNTTENPLLVQVQADDPQEPEYYSLSTSVSPVNSGSVLLVPDKEEYEEDEWVTLFPVPADSYEFSGWSGADGQDVVDNKIRMSSDKSVRADFIIPEPEEPDVVTVSTSDELMAAAWALKQDNVTIVLEDGEYQLSSPLYITGDHVTIKSKSQDPGKVTIKGQGMAGSVTHVFQVSGNDFTAQDLTIGWVKHHAVQLHGESGADRFILRGIHFKDSGQQMVKVSFDPAVPDFCENGLIEDCTFDYTAGVGPQWYIGGVDAHHVKNLVVQDNLFKHIISPESGMSEGAVHVWSDSQDTMVRRNVIIKCDRGIMFGLDNSPHFGGWIINNTIHTTRDVGIYLAEADGAKVYNNTVFIDSSYANAIEYRFDRTDATIVNNITNKPISSRNNGAGLVENNVTEAMDTWFVSAYDGDLHLASPVYSVIDNGTDLAEITDDIDQEPRQAGTIDLGADELVGVGVKQIQSVTVLPDKTTIIADGIDLSTLDVQVTYEDGTTEPAMADSFICHDQMNNPVDMYSNSFSTYKAGDFSIRAVVQDVQSDAVTITAVEKDYSNAQISDLSAIHRDGQTFLRFKEVISLIPSEDISYEDFFTIMDNYSRDITYNIYRSQYPIDDVANLSPIGSVGLLSGWNTEFYGLYRSKFKNKQAIRYVISDGQAPLAKDEGLFVHNPDHAGAFYYAVTVSVDGVENTNISDSNRLSAAVTETVGQGSPVLQRVEEPDLFDYERNPRLYFYTRWEAPPNSSVEGKPYDYLVGIPETPADPAPVGIHMHCWGGNLTAGYGWWNNAKTGAILLASNQFPYDWWTGYHESIYTDTPAVTEADWQSGVVRPYSQNRIFSFLEWMDQRSGLRLDLNRIFTAGTSMGGSGSLMMAIRYSEQIAWSRSWVGVHDPNNSPWFSSSYANVYGKPEYNVLFENGTPVWDYFNDVWYLKQYPKKEIGFLTFSNGKNDDAIGWQQAVDFVKALQETRRPFLFIWGQSGHGQRTVMPLNNDERTMPIDIRIDQTLPAFTYCSLDDDMGNGDPADGDPQGQINKYLYWETSDIVDTLQTWEMTVGLIDSAPQESCSVDITPRRCQLFKPAPGQVLTWENRDPVSGQVIDSGSITVDDNGLFTIPQTSVKQTTNRIVISQ